MMKIVMVNVDFIDAYTGEMHKTGSKVEMTEDRIAEVKAVNPEFVSVIGTVAEPAQTATVEPVVEPVAEPDAKPKKATKKAE